MEGGEGRGTGEVAAALERRWARLVAAVPWGGRASAGGAVLVDRYREPWRRYHTVEHLAAVLGVLDDLCDGGPEPVVELAAWFHDAVYDPVAHDNEARSRDLALGLLGEWGAPAGDAARVGDLVMATATHVADDPAAAALLDADLSILGAAPATYDAYAAAVREEYGHVADADYRRGRAAVLGSFLARPRLYVTDRGVARFEAAARANVAREVAALTR